MKMLKHAAILIGTALISCAVSAASYPPNIDYGNQGDFITKRGVEYGRTAMLTTLGPVLINFPEGPGSSSVAIDQIRAEDTAWDLSDLTNPQLIKSLTCDGCFRAQPIEAHGTVHRFDVSANRALLSARGINYLYHDAAAASQAEQIVRINEGVYAEHGPPDGYSRMTSPHHMRNYWEYRFDSSGLYSIRDTGRFLSSTADTGWLGDTENVRWKGTPIVSWDHLGLTGVTGFSVWLGELLIVASDQQQTGIAVYDTSGYRQGQIPELLSVYNPVLTEPDGRAGFPSGHEVGIGGYWVEPYGANKVVWAARWRNGAYPRRANPAMYVVDFTDPRNPRLSCELYFNQDQDGAFSSADGDDSSGPMYVNFQDNYAYVDHFKVDITACEQAYANDGTISESEFSSIVYKFRDIDNECEASQYFRPLGQVGIFGGRDYWRTSDVNEQGMCFFVTQDQPDTNPPYVAGHRPLDGQTNFPTDGFVHIHIPETLRSETVVNAISLVNLNTGTPVSFKHQLTHTGTIAVWPDQELEPNSSYQVAISGVRDFMGNTMTPYSFSFSTGDSVVPAPDPGPTPPPGPTPGPGTAPSFSGTAFYPQTSSPLACEPEVEDGSVWVVNPDNNSVTIVDRRTDDITFDLSLSLEREIKLGYEEPTSVTKIRGLFAVTYRKDDKVVFFDQSGSPLRALDTGHGSQPIASVTDGEFLYVALYGSGEIVKINLANWDISSRLSVGPYPRAMALHEGRLLVTRFISPENHGEVYDIDTNGNMSLDDTIIVNKVTVADDIDHGSGVPNYLSGIVIDQNGFLAYVTANKANTDRGLQRSGVALDDDNTVRPMIAIIDLIAGQDLNANPDTREGTSDLDNGADPSSVTFLADPTIRVHTLRGNNLVVANDLEQNRTAQFNTGLAPTGICSTLRTLYVKNFSERSITAIDVAGYMHDGNLNPASQSISTVTDEVLSADELNGLQQFYHSRMPEMGPEGYMSCASCHTDGGHDGRTWDMTALGEGIRNTISLNGASGTRFGNLHWSSNFDEVQDFEMQIEHLNGGTGLIEGRTFFDDSSPLDVTTSGLSEDLDALAAYVNGLGKDSVQRSPHRTYTGELTESAGRGQQLFEDQGCATCHTGAAFRDGRSHDVGTLSYTSGSRLGGALDAIRTPTLIELWDSAPYFHDGSAATLEEVLATGDHAVDLNASQREDLIEFLRSIDRDMYIDD